MQPFTPLQDPRPHDAASLVVEERFPREARSAGKIHALTCSRPHRAGGRSVVVVGTMPEEGTVLVLDGALAIQQRDQGDPGASRSSPDDPRDADFGLTLRWTKWTRPVLAANHPHTYNPAT